jgi:hypothetical protein
MVAAVTDTAMAADQGISEVSGIGDKSLRLFEIARPLNACRSGRFDSTRRTHRKIDIELSREDIQSINSIAPDRTS